MPFKSPLNEDLYDLWMCQNEDCGAVRAIGISEANASDSLRQQELEDLDLECKVCGKEGMEKIVPADRQSNDKTSTTTETTKPLLATGSTGIKIRQSYVVNHLQAIDIFEFKVRSIELTQKGNNWNEIPSETKQRYITYSTSAITRCIAFLEATVNEMIRRITASESDLAGAGYEIHPSLRAQANANRVRSLVTDRKPFFEKYDVILEEKAKKSIPTGHGIGQQAVAVNDLRNHLMHGIPELLAPDKIPKGAEGLPKEVRWSNPFDADDISMAPLDRCLGSMMIEWAADSCFEYAEAFFDQLDIENDISPDATPLSELVIDENPARPYVVALEGLQHKYR
jgi:hypothetical protein